MAAGTTTHLTSLQLTQQQSMKARGGLGRGKQSTLQYCRQACYAIALDYHVASQPGGVKGLCKELTSGHNQGKEADAAETTKRFLHSHMLDACPLGADDFSSFETQGLGG